VKKKELSVRTREKLVKKIQKSNKITPSSEKIEETVLNKSLRKLILERDGHSCRYCGKDNHHFKRSLHVHHIDYDPKNSDINNLIALCPRCHRNTNLNRAFWREYLKKLVEENGNSEVTE